MIKRKPRHSAAKRWHTHTKQLLDTIFPQAGNSNRPTPCSVHLLDDARKDWSKPKLTMALERFIHPQIMDLQIPKLRQLCKSNSGQIVMASDTLTIRCETQGDLDSGFVPKSYVHDPLCHGPADCKRVSSCNAPPNGEGSTFCSYVL